MHDAVPSDRVFGGAGPGLLLLSVVAGTMDSLSFLKLGHVFTSAMSGNTILFGLALGQGHLSAAAHSIAAFLGYVAGVAVAAAVFRHAEAVRRHGAFRVLAGETALLGAFALVWVAGGAPHSAASLYVLILLAAVAMGLQGAAARHLNVPGVSTIVFTSTLTNIVTDCANAVAAPGPMRLAARTWRQIAAFAAYLASAIVTGLAMGFALPAIAILPFAALLLVVGGMGAGWLQMERAG